MHLQTVLTTYQRADQLSRLLIVTIQLFSSRDSFVGQKFRSKVQLKHYVSLDKLNQYAYSIQAGAPRQIS